MDYLNSRLMEIKSVGEIEEEIQEIRSDVEELQDDVVVLQENVEDMQEDISSLETGKQDTLVSGQNIKTINNQSILGSGDITISATTSWGNILGDIEDQDDLQEALDEKQDTLVSGDNIKTINGNNILGSGNLEISSFPTQANAGDSMVFDGASWTKQGGYGYTSQYVTHKFDNKYIDTIDNLNSTSTKPLTANMGKYLSDQINNLKSLGRFLSIWNCATGLPNTNPETLPYLYKTGDYYRVGNVSSGTNYKPFGSSYNNVASTTIETNPIKTSDVYYYDGSVWQLQSSESGKGATWGEITGSISNQTDLQNALNSKQDTLVSGTNIKTLNNSPIIGEGNISIEGLPTTTTAGTAMVHNGTSWTQQSGYGYEVQGTGESLTWNGEITGKDVIDASWMGKFYKLSTNTPAASAFSNVSGKWSDDSSISFNNPPDVMTVSEYFGQEPGAVITGDGSKLLLVMAANGFICGVVSTMSQTLTISLPDEYPISMVIPSNGTYLLKTDEVYTASLSYGTQGTLQKIDSKFIPEDSVLANAKTNAGIGWVESGTTTKSVTWDGDTTGKEIVTMTEEHGGSADTLYMYKVSNDAPTLENLKNQTFKWMYNGSEDTFRVVTNIEEVENDTIYIGIMPFGTATIGDASKLYIMTADGIQGVVALQAQTLVIVEGSSTNTFTIPSPGIYFTKETSTSYSSYLSYVATSSVYHKISSDLVDDTNKTNKFVTSAEKSTWSGKQDALVSGTNIKTINNQSVLGSGNLNISGFPTSATAGTAMIHNGTSWAQQTGYGYESQGSEVVLTWDGNTTGKETLYNHYCKLTSNVPASAESLIGKTIKGMIDGVELTGTINSTVLGAPNLYYLFNDNDDLGLVIIVAFQDTVFIEEGEPDVPVSKGIWFNYVGSDYNTYLNYISESVTHKIDSKFIPEDEVLASAKANSGIGWKSSGTAESVTWDGDTIGKQHIHDEEVGVDAYKIRTTGIGTSDSKDSFIGGTYTKKAIETGTEYVFTMRSVQVEPSLNETWVVDSSDNVYLREEYGFEIQGCVMIFDPTGYPTFSSVNGGTISTFDEQLNATTFTIPAGVWLTKIEGLYYVSSVVCASSTVTHQILSEFIPHDTTKQDTLVSGTNIKTINNQSLLGQGNVSVGTISTSEGTPGTPISMGYVPQGGTTGQVLVKNSNTDFDTGWQNPSGGIHKYQHNVTFVYNIDSSRRNLFVISIITDSPTPYSGDLAWLNFLTDTSSIYGSMMIPMSGYMGAIDSYANVTKWYKFIRVLDAANYMLFYEYQNSSNNKMMSEHAYTSQYCSALSDVVIQLS